MPATTTSTVPPRLVEDLLVGGHAGSCACATSASRRRRTPASGSRRSSAAGWSELNFVFSTSPIRLPWSESGRGDIRERLLARLDRGVEDLEVCHHALLSLMSFVTASLVRAAGPAGDIARRRRRRARPPRPRGCPRAPATIGRRAVSSPPADRARHALGALEVRDAVLGVLEHELPDVRLGPARRRRSSACARPRAPPRSSAGSWCCRRCCMSSQSVVSTPSAVLESWL